MNHKKIFIIVITLITAVICFTGTSTILPATGRDMKITELATVNTGGNTYFVQVIENLAVVSDVGYNGLKVYNITDPRQPLELGTYRHEGGGPHDIVIREDLVYLADRGDGLEILNISDPTNPTFLAQIDTGGYAWGLQIAANFAYVADNNEGLKIIDISNPLAPSIVGNFSSPNCNGLQVVNDSIAYITDWQVGIKIIDVTDPTNCTLLGSFENLTNPWGVIVEDHVAYIPDMSNGLKIVNVSDSGNPRQLAHIGLSSTSCLHVQIVDDLAFISKWDDGLEIVDISNPQQPIELIQYDGVKDTKMVTVEENLIFAADGLNGLVILEMNESSPSSQSSPSFGPILLFSALVTLSVVSKLGKKGFSEEKVRVIVS